MALITTTGSLIRQYNAFTGLSATERSQSGIARAEVVYYNVNDSWPSPGAGNNRLYQTGNIDLPKDFGYVLTDAFLLVDAGGYGAIATEAVAQGRLYPGGVLGPQINVLLESHGSRQDTNASTAIGSINADVFNSIFPSIDGNDFHMQYGLVNKPTSLLYPFGSNAYTSAANPASVFNFAVGEASTQLANYTVSCYIRFLQYDIDQSYNYVVQSPQLTR